LKIKHFQDCRIKSEKQCESEEKIKPQIIAPALILALIFLGVFN